MSAERSLNRPRLATTDLPVDVRAIEAELTRRWLEQTAGAAGLVRTFSLTLLVPLEDQALAERVDAALDRVAETHPCRSILVILTETEPRARLAVHFRPATPGQPALFWEEIRLEGPPSAASRLLSAADSLVLPNLPVDTWWPGDPDFTGRLAERLVQVADRIIVDSSHFSHPLSSLANYADQSDAEHGSVAFVDLNWQRIEPWRLRLAGIFDEPEARVFLNFLESVVISYCAPPSGGPGGLAQALLLIGWLASRLGWRVAAERVGRYQVLEELIFDDGGRWVQVELRRQPPSPTDGDGLTAVEIWAMHDGEPGIFSVERSGESGTVSVQVGETRREQTVRLQVASEDNLLRHELLGFGRNRIYEDALHVVRLLARQAESTPGPR